MMPEPSILDERLAEIDRRLRTIQSGLVSVPDESPPAAAGSLDDDGPLDAEEPIDDRQPGAVTPPARAGEAPLGRGPEPLRLVAPAEPAGPAAATQLAELVEAHERLLELHRELLSQYAEVLERRAGESVTVAVTAGPFTNAGSVRDFERALAALPGVSAVTVREYLGDSQVQIDVQLLGG